VASAGLVFDSERRPHDFGKFSLARHPLLRTRQCQAVAPVSMMITGQLFTETGGFSEAFVSAGEDLDLCFKIRAHARRVVVCCSTRASTCLWTISSPPTKPCFATTRSIAWRICRN